MRWWKFGMIASVALVLLVVILACGRMWYISSHPMGEAVDEARAEKLGEVVGGIFGAGLAAIWAFALLRFKKRSRA